METIQLVNKKKVLAPKLRFSEFKKSWTPSKLGPFIEQYKERVPANTKIPILTSSRTGLYKQSDYFDNRELSNEGEYGVVPRGYFTYRHMSDDSTFKFNINNLCDKGAVSKEYPVFTTINMDIKFLYHKLNHGSELKRFAIAQKLGGTRVRLYYKKLRELEFNIPAITEQQKIVSFLSEVDEKIQLLTSKKELLEQYKKGVMQQLFSGKLRFNDENGKVYPKWEEKKLGEIGEFQTSSVDKLSIVGEKEVRLVNYMNVYRHENISQETIKDLQVVTAKDNQINSSNLKKGDILFTPSSETPTDIGHSVVIFEDLNNCVYSYHLMRFRPKIKIDILYSHYFCNIPSVLSQLSKLATGSTRFTISVKSFSSIKVNLPCIEEQKKIAKFLSSLDAKLENINNQITQTQIFKKGLLQQMFV